MTLQLPWDLRLTPEQFERVCQANPDAVLELAADGQLIAKRRPMEWCNSGGSAPA
jgi:Uma2 family endonuclease